MEISRQNLITKIAGRLEEIEAARHRYFGYVNEREQIGKSLEDLDTEHLEIMSNTLDSLIQDLYTDDIVTSDESSTNLSQIIREKPTLLS